MLIKEILKDKNIVLDENLLNLNVLEVKYVKGSSMLEIYIESAYPKDLSKIEEIFESLLSLPVTVFAKENPDQVLRIKEKKEIIKPKTSLKNHSIGRISKKDIQQLVSLDQLEETFGLCTIEGRTFDLNTILTKNGYLIVSFALEDGKGSAVLCKGFYKEKDHEQVLSFLSNDQRLLVKGKMQYDTYQECQVFMISAMEELEKESPKDQSPEKRVELSVHTQMTSMEGLINLNDLKKRLKDFGHTAVAVTDKGTCQAFPEMYWTFKDSGIQAIYGYHAKILEDELNILNNPYGLDVDEIGEKFTVFDIETTGFSRFQDRIIEIGAVRYEDGERIESFSEFVDPGRRIPEHITELTGITDTMVEGADPIDQVLQRFLDFSKGTILVAHNAEFDMGFIRENAFQMQVELKNPYIDTLAFARALYPDLKNHKLNTLTKEFRVKLDNHHRAIDDAEATGQVFMKLFFEWKKRNEDFSKINATQTSYPIAKNKDYESLIYIKEQRGVKNLYTLVSMANMDYFFRSPGIPKSLLEKHRQGLIVVQGFIGSKLFDAVSKRFPDEILNDLVSSCDYLAVEPISFVEKAILKESCGSEEDYISFIEKIISLGKENHIPVVAIGSSYYLNPSEKRARNILVNYQRKLEFERRERYRFLNTQEMLDGFYFLSPNLREEIVIQNTKQFAKAMEEITPIPQGKFTPSIEGASEELRKVTYEKAYREYGKPLAKEVEERLERELSSIIENGYASLYLIARELVKKSNADGYLVGSRGSVGSSFAAYAADITEVNPLSPHYVCPSCHYCEFIHDGSVDAGFDLKAKSCPTCGKPLKRDGHNIPFEVFLGFKGNKEPDIDLNFAGEYMPIIHKYTEEIFGKGKVFRAGTISGTQSKTAFGFIKKYLEQDYIPEEDRNLNPAQIALLQEKMEGTRRTTGQHAGGLIIIPKEYDVLDFTPIQYPADDLNSDTVTTHFSFRNLEGTLLKLDELGHTSPTVIRQLQDLSGINAINLHFDDQETLSIFSSSEALQIKHPYSNENDGALGIPEFGTDFVRGMLRDTKPTTFAELTRISGLSHGTDVWLNNAQDLVRQDITDLKHAICTRDDIMTFLISKGMDKHESFTIMEHVRKGRGIPGDGAIHMKEHGIADWYIESCQKIKYMFPKAHATAYVMMSYRIAWFKVHHPLAFYASFYSQKLKDFSTAFLFRNLTDVQSYMKELKNQEEKVDGDKWALLEVIEEMYARDIHFAPIDLMLSSDKDFLIVDDKILPPLSTLDDVSEAMASDIVRVRKESKFLSREEFKEKTGVNKSAMASLEASGLLDHLPRSNQMDLFSYL